MTMDSLENSLQLRKFPWYPSPATSGLLRQGGKNGKSILSPVLISCLDSLHGFRVRVNQDR